MIARTPRTAVLAATLAMLAGAISCGSAGPPTAPDARLIVVASTDVWAGVVRAVTGDAVEITTIMDDPAADPHSYEAGPADAADVEKADLVVYNGGGYDEFLTQFLDRAGGKPAVEAVAVAGPQARANEHVWYDLAVVREVAARVADELGRLAPGQAQRFTAGAERFGTELDRLGDRVGAIADAHAGEPVAMTEPVAYYLVAAAKLTDRTPPEFVQAVEEETDPPARAVAALQDLLRQRQVGVLIYNPQTETPVISQVRAAAEAAGIPVVTMTETLPDGVGYIGWMSGQIDALSRALG